MKKTLLYFISIALLTSCGAPRNFNHSGRALDQGQVQVQLDNTINIPVTTLGKLSEYSTSALSSAAGDTLHVDGAFEDFATAIMGYAYDPLGFYPGIGFKVGLGHNIDLGYTRASGVNIFDLKYQFYKVHDLGGTGAYENELDASMGFRFATQSYEMPSVLSSLQELLGYQMDRKDYIWNMTVSRTFKKKQEYGFISGGLIIGRSSISYDWSLPGILEVYNDQLEQIVPMPRGEVAYTSYGAFVSTKIGYRWIYLLVSLSAYYQNYPDVELFGKTFSPGSGLSLVPSIGIQLNFNSKWTDESDSESD